MKNNKMKNEEQENNQDPVEQDIKDVNEEGKQAEKEGGKVSPAEEWQQKYNEINDKYLRLYSEFDNFRKRTQKEKLELYKTAGEDIILALLPVLDDFERAEKAMQEEREINNIKEGINLIHHKLINTLENKGLKPMDSSVGNDFDLEKQEAITRIPAPSADMKGKVIDEVERGYTLNEKVIRFSKVVIGE